MPASILVGQRTPGVFIQTDNSLAGSSASAKVSLLVGGRLAAGTVADGVLTQITAPNADVEFGAASTLGRMVRTFRANNPQGVLYCIGVDDNGAGVDATGTITITGTATEAGTLYCYIGGQLLEVAVASGDAFGTVAASIVTAVTAATTLPVSAGAVGGVVTYTALNAGETGNDIHIGFNLLGAVGGQSVPAGLTAVRTTVMASGATNPVMTTTLAAMVGSKFDYIAMPYTDTVSVAAWLAEMADTGTGRWNEAEQLYGHVWSARRGTQGQLTTYGNARNDPHLSVFANEAELPTPTWEIVAQALGQASLAFSGGAGAAARPLQTLVLTGAFAPPPADRFTITERQTLLTDGMATLTHKGGITAIERSITTYQTDDAAAADDSYLDVTTLTTLQEINERISSTIKTKYPRHKLVDDGTKFDSGQAVVTPGVIRGELVSLYRTFEREALVENAAAFIAGLTVTRSIGDPNRLDVLYTPDLANGLRVFALLNQFRLQFA